MVNEKTNLVLNEIITMRSLSHSNIHFIYTSFVEEMNVFIVSPLTTYGSAKMQITNNFSTGLPEIIVALILRDVLFGLEYLHKKGYIHRAIRASHILLDSSKAVLCGFRECTNLISSGTIVNELYDLPESGKGLNWLAPEVLEQNILGYSKASMFFFKKNNIFSSWKLQYYFQVIFTALVLQFASLEMELNHMLICLQRLCLRRRFEVLHNLFFWTIQRVLQRKFQTLESQNKQGLFTAKENCLMHFIKSLKYAFRKILLIDLVLLTF